MCNLTYYLYWHEEENDEHKIELIFILEVSKWLGDGRRKDIIALVLNTIMTNECINGIIAPLFSCLISSYDNHLLLVKDCQ
jgi:hypothetical protein